MTISPVSGGVTSGVLGGGAPNFKFKPPVSLPTAARAVVAPAPPKPTVATKVLSQVQSAQARMDSVLKLAQSGKHFSAAELLSLQTHVYRASQELDLAGKVVEKATGGVKQVLQTQV